MAVPDIFATCRDGALSGPLAEGPYSGESNTPGHGFPSRRTAPGTERSQSRVATASRCDPGQAGLFIGESAYCGRCRSLRATAVNVWKNAETQAHEMLRNQSHQFLFFSSLSSGSGFFNCKILQLFA